MAGVLKGKVAVITGSGSGAGKATALAMAREGAHIMTNDVAPGRAEATAKEIINAGGQAAAFTGDISDFKVAGQLVQAAVDKFGKIDILNNNAGIIRLGMIWDMSEEDWDRVMDINLKGAFNCTRHACAFMKERRWGRILNASSVAWLGYGSWGQSNYGASKAGIVGLTRAVALEMKTYNVTCNAYCPRARGGLWTSDQQRIDYFNRAVDAGIITEQEAKDFSFNRPDPETTVPLLIYLCTDDASNITGLVFDIKWGDISVYSEPKQMKTIHKNYKEKGLWTLEELKSAVPKMVKF